LGDEVCGRAEAVNPDRLGISCQPQRPMADQTGAQPRRHLGIGLCTRNGKAVPGVGNRVLCVTAVQLVAGEAWSVTKVLALRPAVAARPACVAEPGYANALPDTELCDAGAKLGDMSDDLVPWNNGQLWVFEIPVDDVEIGPAHAACRHLHENLRRRGGGRRKLHLPKRRPWPFEHHRLHFFRPLTAP
jgi:hypothetical protein